MSERHLFLDFDGVINGLSTTSVRDEWGDVVSARMQGFPISYAPELVRAIETMATAGVTVTWLTTWCEHTADFPQFGFAPRPYLGAVDYGLPWWKWPALQDHVASLPPDALIGWCDDDLAESAQFDPTIRDFIGQERVLGISPHGWRGLTRKHIADLRTHFGIEAAS